MTLDETSLCIASPMCSWHAVESSTGEGEVPDTLITLQDCGRLGRSLLSKVASGGLRRPRSMKPEEHEATSEQLALCAPCLQSEAG